MVKLSPFEIVKAARSTEKITTSDLIRNLVPDFFELHGDRGRLDDAAVIGGIGTLNGRPITIVGTQKGEDLAENINRHFGSAEPEGYRKILRLMKQAEKFHRPILALINTPGAYPDMNAEYHGQGSAIANCLLEEMQLQVPYLSIVIGEGGSGGALALACGNQVWMTEQSTYSVLSPEGYASIMWKDSSRVEEAAKALHLTPTELLNEQIIDRVIPEVRNAEDIHDLRKIIFAEFQKLEQLSATELVEQRYRRFRKY
ncbi:carboxyltransferase subunit alpha [Pediococcus argentinicus]|uniref:acetyl-CoA carboxytransferase n=1 Tax=Pediococcus argentinicus TaxID=480391 RepID=A0A0R2NI75_9LACO|nr:carboxyltransferase subunit alpha [Pediococcus argentinicus]KRO25495.1 acetyl-coa carboxylase alpha subunit [Pediococcus argentinicus]NKZ22189.1 acetyl-CoA carboxylase carboxyl transferase subunit alpha [Pediococcus argentinicus]GEP19238.1 acetyl-CoA carboxylase carboxyl transferase subunit alpha [Pediococcus argentinicus]